MYVLGICYGMQLIIQKFGGVVTIGEKQEYGKMEISVEECGLYGLEAIGGTQTVWMSHGDEVVKLPEGFTVAARSLQGSVVAIENRSRRFYGLQYHPEIEIILRGKMLSCFASYRDQALRPRTCLGGRGVPRCFNGKIHTEVISPPNRDEVPSYRDAIPPTEMMVLHAAEMMVLHATEKMEMGESQWPRRGR